MLTKSPLLLDWCIGTHQFSAYNAPETCTRVARGEVHGHSRLRDRERITTTQVIAFDPKRRVLLTKNTFYRLGSMSNGFKQWLRKNNYKIADYAFNTDAIPRRNLWHTVTKA